MPVPVFKERPKFLKTFFNYYGGKWRIAPRYPAPVYDTIVEPFAGAAGYSMRHYEKNVVLNDLDPVIVGVWRYLIAAEPEDIMRLPVIGEFDHVDQIDAPQGARDLIGFCVNAGASAPRKVPSKWARSRPSGMEFWSVSRRARVAAQVPYIKHWVVKHGAYGHLDTGLEATWFVDPPYQGDAGSQYRHGSGGIDFENLQDFVLSLKGQVIACEGAQSKWLRFRHFHDAKATTKGVARVSREFIWTNSDG